MLGVFICYECLAAAACQVRDLRRLLELYQRWQPRVFNHCSYNQFEQTLEKMSGTYALKVRFYTCKWLPATHAAVKVEPDEREVFRKDLECATAATAAATYAAAPPAVCSAHNTAVALGTWHAAMVLYSTVASLLRHVAFSLLHGLWTWSAVCQRKTHLFDFIRLLPLAGLMFAAIPQQDA
jgi:hypothetical protein